MKKKCSLERVGCCVRGCFHFLLCSNRTNHTLGCSFEQSRLAIAAMSEYGRATPIHPTSSSTCKARAFAALLLLLVSHSFDFTRRRRVGADERRWPVRLGSWLGLRSSECCLSFTRFDLRRFLCAPRSAHVHARARDCFLAQQLVRTRAAEHYVGRWC